MRTYKLEPSKDLILLGYQNGTSLKNLAIAYSVSVGTIRNTIKRAGVELRPRGRKKKD